MEREFPTDEDEIIELARKIIKGMTNNPDFPDPPVPMAELQKHLDEVLKAKHAEAVAKEAERQATEKAQAAWEELYLAQQSMREYNRKHGIRDNDTHLVTSGRAGQADRFFSQFSDQDESLQIQKKEKG
ncbi:MAG: hypothetical protein WGN25_05335 [Candidatus Electrothrix sp. GW3-4]|uniref:hypothetical protein n=1 Tax=Candidatus Electrothrix sp. GW3-4 TaxID=3126740 RepID=UPI0030D20885